MQSLAAVIMPIIMSLIVISGLVKKQPVFNCFLEGAKDGIETMFSIAPSLIGLITAIGMLKASGALSMLTDFLSPVTSFIGFPDEVTPLLLLRPISGSGSLAVLNQIIEDNGADSFAARVASVMTGSTETTFYCISVYFGAVGVKKTLYTIPSAILGDFAGMVMACITVRLSAIG